MSNVKSATFDMEIPCKFFQGVRTCIPKISHAHAARRKAERSEGCVGCVVSVAVLAVLAVWAMRAVWAALCDCFGFGLCSDCFRLFRLFGFLEAFGPEV